MKDIQHKNQLILCIFIVMSVLCVVIASSTCSFLE